MREVGNLPAHRDGGGHFSQCSQGAQAELVAVLASSKSRIAQATWPGTSCLGCLRGVQMSDSWSSGSESSAVATGECTDGPDGVSGGLHSSGKRRKRPASELVQGACTEACGAPGPRGDYEEFQPFKNLTLTQRSIIRRVVKTLDTEEDSVVITNPLVPQSPIVYVTNAWQDMCGYNMQQAVGQNPRLTQGEGTDPETVRTMKNALIKQQPCRVRIINYRGYNHEPFWNCLSVRARPLHRASPRAPPHAAPPTPGAHAAAPPDFFPGKVR